MPASQKKLPDFLIIGAAKSGTTALFKAIGRHPHVFSPTRKEPRFFAYAGNPPMFHGPGGAANAREVCHDEANYLKLFKNCGPHQLAFEASTEYLANESAPETAAKYVPSTRLVVVLRHPVERAFSHYLHLRSEGVETCASFKEAWDSCQLRRTAGWRPVFDYKSRGFYGAQLTRWAKHFSPEKFLILFYEDWLSRPTEVLCRTWKHVGLEPMNNPIVTRENVSSRQPRWQWLHRHMVDPENPIRLLAQRTLPLWARDAVTGPVTAINLTQGPTLDPEIRRSLAETYHDDLEVVEKMTGRNLDAWRS
jgi:hypothetical protein